MSLKSGTQCEKYMVKSGHKTVLIHVSQLSALHQKYGSQQLHTWYG